LVDYSSTKVQQKSMLNIPDELLIEIFSFLTPSQIYLKGSLISKKWRSLLLKDIVWRNWFSKTFKQNILPTPDLSCLHKYRFKLEKHFKCRLCNLGSPLERKVSQLISPCECNYFIHSACIVNNKETICPKCLTPFEQQFQFNIPSFCVIVSYIVVLIGSQAVVAISPFLLGSLNFRKKKIELVLNKKTFHNGYKLLGKFGIGFWCISSILKHKTFYNAILTLILCYKMSYSDSKLFGLMMIHLLQTMMLPKIKNKLDNQLGSYLWKINETNENEDKFYL
jgi:hypothetical protein